MSTYLHLHASGTRKLGRHGHDCSSWQAGTFTPDDSAGDWVLSAPDRLRQQTGRSEVTLAVGSEILVGPPITAKEPNRVWVYFAATEAPLSMLTRHITKP